MAYTKDEDVANEALGLLGVDTITNLGGGDYPGVTQNSYDLTVNSLMEMADWKWLQTHAALTSATAPLIQWQYAFNQPANIVGNPIALYDTDGVGARPVSRWQRMGSLILADYAALWALFRQRKAVVRWPASFVDLSAHALAARWAVPVTENRTNAEFYTAIAFGTPQENGRGGLFRTAVNNDFWSDPTISLMQNDDPIGDARFGDIWDYGTLR